MIDATIERRRYFAYYLLLADSIKPMLGTCQKEVNYHWFSCDSWRLMGARHVWGRSVKCLELIADVSFARLTPSLCSLFFALPPSFSLNFSRLFPCPRPTRGKGKRRLKFRLSQFRSLHVTFWKCLLRRLPHPPYISSILFRTGPLTRVTRQWKLTKRQENLMKYLCTFARERMYTG